MLRSRLQQEKSTQASDASLRLLTKAQFQMTNRCDFGSQPSTYIRFTVDYCRNTIKTANTAGYE